MQLRVAGMGGAYALDFGAVMMVGTARRVDIDLLAEVLPMASRIIVENLACDDDRTKDGE